MRCSAARRRLLEATLRAEPDPHDASALERHLASCSSCAAEARDGRRLVGDLERLRLEIPFPLDVTESVMAGLARSGGSARPEVPRPWVRAIAVATLAAAAATAWVLIGSAPLLGAQAGRLWALIEGMTGALAEIARPLLHLAGAAGTLALHASAAASPLLTRMALAAPSYATSAACVGAAMSVVTAWVVQRDLRRTALTRSKKESSP